MARAGGEAVFVEARNHVAQGGEGVVVVVHRDLGAAVFALAPAVHAGFGERNV